MAIAGDAQAEVLCRPCQPCRGAERESHGLPQQQAILDDGGNITVGRVGGECVAAVSTSHDCPVMLVRREGESFLALLRRLDRSIGKAWDNEMIIDEVNG